MELIKYGNIMNKKFIKGKYKWLISSFKIENLNNEISERVKISNAHKDVRK